MAEHTNPEPTAKSAASKLFDLRIMIGGLFVVYGVLLLIHSFFDSPETIAKAAGVHLNLWMGLWMLAGGIVFLAWAKLKPQRPPSAEEIEAAKNDPRPQH